MAIQAYIADQTISDERTRQLAFVLAMNFFGLFFGSLMMAILAGYSFPFWSIFIFVAAFYSSDLLLIFFALPEKMKPSQSDDSIETSETTKVTDVESPDLVPVDQQAHSTSDDSSQRPTSQTPPPPTSSKSTAHTKSWLHYCLRLKNFSETFETLTKWRPNNRRCYLIITYLCILLQNMCKSGEVDVLLLFVMHSPLNWSKSWYAYLLSSQYATVAVLLLFLMPFLLKNLRLEDATIVISCTLIKVGPIFLTFKLKKKQIQIIN